MHRKNWGFTVVRWVLFMIGVFFIGFSIALMLRSRLGLNPWDVFHQGVTYYVPWTMGQVMQGTGVILIFIAWLLGYKPGLGTLVNMWGIGFFFDLVVGYIPEPVTILSRLGLFLAGTVLCGWGVGLYIACGLGAGPRDSVMMALHNRTGKKISGIRTGIELSALSTGWLMGGTVGVGTLIYSVSIGFIVAWFIPKMEALIQILKRAMIKERGCQDESLLDLQWDGTSSGADC